MSRSQKNVRRRQTAKKAPQGGSANQAPAGVTEKDGAANRNVGTPNPRTTADDYRGWTRTENT